MIQAILKFFGVGTKTNTDTTQPLTEGKTKTGVKVQNVSAASTKRPPTPIPVPVAAQKKRKRHAPQKRTVTKSSVNAKKYYKRGGSFYSIDDDCLIEDVLMLVVLAELFDDGDITDMDVSESTEDLLDIDVSETPVVDSTEWKVEVPAEPEPIAPKFESEPEPTRYDSGSSYASGSSDYDSGSSDSGGSDD